MWRKSAQDSSVPKGRAGGLSAPLIVALLGVLIMQGGRAQGAAPRGSGGTDAGPIDISITVQPSRVTKPAQRIGGMKTKSGLAVQQSGQQAPRTPNDLTTPNAIGFPVAKPGAHQPGLPGGPRPMPQSGLTPASPIASGNAGVAGAGTKLAPRATINRAVNGTGMTHLGTSPAGMVQGTPKSLGTITGTSFQRRR